MLTPTPFSLGLIIMGNSQVAFDAVCSTIIGLDPRSIDHLRLAEDYGFGTTDLGKIAITGDVSLEEAIARAKGFKVGLIRVEKYFEGTSITAYAGPPPEPEHSDYCWGGCPGAIEEAIEILRLYDKFKPFADECREKQRPGFVDLQTYRYQGHSMSDPQKYRTKEEVEGVKKKDSLDQLAIYCMNEKKTLTEEQFIAMQREVKETVARAIVFAEESPIPEMSELYTDVYANPMKNLSPTREYAQGAKNPLL